MPLDTHQPVDTGEIAVALTLKCEPCEGGYKCHGATILGPVFVTGMTEQQAIFNAKQKLREMHNIFFEQRARTAYNFYDLHYPEFMEELRERARNGA